MHPRYTNLGATLLSLVSFTALAAWVCSLAKVPFDSVETFAFLALYAIAICASAVALWLRPERNLLEEHRLWKAETIIQWGNIVPVFALGAHRAFRDPELVFRLALIAMVVPRLGVTWMAVRGSGLPSLPGWPGAARLGGVLLVWGTLFGGWWTDPAGMSAAGWLGLALLKGAGWAGLGLALAWRWRTEGIPEEAALPALAILLTQPAILFSAGWSTPGVPLIGALLVLAGSLGTFEERYAIGLAGACAAAGYLALPGIPGLAIAAMMLTLAFQSRLKNNGVLRILVTGGVFLALLAGIAFLPPLSNPFLWRVGLRSGSDLVRILIDRNTGIFWQAPWTILAVIAAARSVWHRRDIESMAFLGVGLTLVLSGAVWHGKSQLALTPYGGLIWLVVWSARWVPEEAFRGGKAGAVLWQAAAWTGMALSLVHLMYPPWVPDRPLLTFGGELERFTGVMAQGFQRFFPSAWSGHEAASLAGEIWLVVLVVLVVCWVLLTWRREPGWSLAAAAGEIAEFGLLTGGTVLLGGLAVAVLSAPRPVAMDYGVYHPDQPLSMPFKAEVTSGAPVSSIEVHSYAGNAYMLPHGQVAGSVRLTRPDGRTEVLPLRIGEHTAEWAFRRPEVVPLMAHAAPDVAYWLPNPEKPSEPIPAFRGIVAGFEPGPLKSVEVFAAEGISMVLRDVKAWAPSRISLLKAAPLRTIDVSQSLTAGKPVLEFELRGAPLIEGVTLLTALSGAVDAPVAEVATVRLLGPDGAMIAQQSLVAGENTAEGFADLPGIQRRLAHRRPIPTFVDYAPAPGTVGWKGVLYPMEIAVEGVRHASKLRVELSPGPVRDLAGASLDIRAVRLWLNGVRREEAATAPERVRR